MSQAWLTLFSFYLLLGIALTILGAYAINGGLYGVTLIGGVVMICLGVFPWVLLVGGSVITMAKNNRSRRD